MEPEPGVNHGSCDITPGCFAIVECGVYDDQTNDLISEIFQPLRTIVGGITHNQVSHFKFFLSDIEAFVRPIAVIPDLGGQPNGYFLLKDRSMWREDFESWLENPDETLEIPVQNDNIPRVHNREAADAWNNDLE